MLTAAMHMLDSSTSSSPWLPPDLMPPPPPPPSAATLHRHFRGAAAAARTSRRIAKRRPRPSRRLPTTYISADPANFRRMVHQVTGADDLPPPPPPSLSPTTTELLRHAAPAGSPGPAGALMLPTLDTSAFLLGRRAEPTAAAAPCDVSVALVGGAGNSYSNNSSCSSSGNCGGGFPTLDSWDLL
ncbi:calmodulin-binding protein 25-like [Oryza glaberrima]|uniref:VQ domain-containing protein n=1 Tax=Oryza glaberrima TaxID=4538 RepID=I1QXB7_ORYGL|nr:calmodulin-binding protein 25-like [Oryza glaberrima]